MIFLIDVDGVVADIIPKILAKLGQKFKGSDVPNYEDITDWGWENIFPADQYDELEKIMDAPGFGSDLPIIAGAKEGLDRIREAGHEVYWVTAPWVSSRTWESDRREWLKDNFDVHPYDIVQTHSKHLVTGDVLIDDRVENIEKWSKAQGKRGLLYSQPWNKKAKDLDRFTWGDIDLLLKMVAS